MSEENPQDSTKELNPLEYTKELNPESEIQESEPADQENQEISYKEKCTDSPKESTDSPKESTDSPKESTDSPKESTDTSKECTDTSKESTETNVTPPSPAEKKTKIEIRLQATGDAPIMKQRNYKVEPGKKIAEIIGFVRKYLKLEDKENLFLYVNQAFAPSPDQTIVNLAECFGSDGKLVLYYSRNQAWG